MKNKIGIDKYLKRIDNFESKERAELRKKLAPKFSDIYNRYKL